MTAQNIECVKKATALIIGVQDADTFDEQCECIVALCELRKALEKLLRKEKPNELLHRT